MRRGLRVRRPITRFVLVAVAVAVGSTAGGAGASGGGQHPAAIVFLASKSGSSVAAVTLDGGRGKITRRYSLAGGRTLSLRPDGRRAAIVTLGSNLRNQLEILDLTDGRSRILATAGRIVGGAGFFGVAAWAPGMEVIAVTHGIGRDRSAIQLLDARTGRVRRSFAVDAHNDSRLAWTADGRSLIFARSRVVGQAPRLRRLDVATGRTVSLRRTGVDPAYGRRGELAFAASDGIRILRDGNEVRVPASLPGDRVPAWMPGGTVLLVERPIGGCPREYLSRMCTRIRVLPVAGGPSRRLFDQRARSPATR